MTCTNREEHHIKMEVTICFQKIMLLPFLCSSPQRGERNIGIAYALLILTNSICLHCTSTTISFEVGFGLWRLLRYRVLYWRFRSVEQTMNREPMSVLPSKKEKVSSRTVAVDDSECMADPKELPSTSMTALSLELFVHLWLLFFIISTTTGWSLLGGLRAVVEPSRSSTLRRAWLTL